METISRIFILIRLSLANISQGVVAGVPFFDEVFKQLDCTYVVPHQTSSTKFKTII
jgi:nicotinate-nucleotide pyrophosphorylase